MPKYCCLNGVPSTECPALTQELKSGGSYGSLEVSLACDKRMGIEILKYKVKSRGHKRLKDIFLKIRAKV